MTPARVRALTILNRSHGRMTARTFAQHMWPNSKGHTTRSRRGATPAGGAIGAGIAMTAGAFLGRLANDGLVGWEMTEHNQSLWSITTKGRGALKEAERG